MFPQVSITGRPFMSAVMSSVYQVHRVPPGRGRQHLWRLHAVERPRAQSRLPVRHTVHSTGVEDSRGGMPQPPYLQARQPHTLVRSARARHNFVTYRLALCLFGRCAVLHSSCHNTHRHRALRRGTPEDPDCAQLFVQANGAALLASVP